ncbi:FAD-dependent oxidoreductase [Saccharopolyspora sp. HNM0983]|uniref:FAD-dependent oxidoreductase n=1 Tax=Saccharopolyspora montiporae TaxID=2781240 RepID=A0A929FY98_9PSEU|nr:FAD-dependent oxidoreductase [Saccharopolyspora sp. HNM0983]MBE9373265.1 FAD-dependent oxidoreductase [Saccharopolyspora sp. HNM0983]
MSTPSSVLVVGASVAGLATAESLRRSGFHGTLTVLGAERHLPYDRPPLSKQVLGGSWDTERVFLRDPDALSALDAEFVLADPAVDLDVDSRTVRTAAGRALRADAIVLATGLRPRTLPGQRDLTGAHVLRTLDDAISLRADLLAARRVVVVGDGVLGTEIAATARSMGCEVTIAGPQPALMEYQLGTTVAERLSALHTERGVELRLGTAVTGLAGHRGRATGVRLATGKVLPGDVVVVAFGAFPATDWLNGSGLDIGDGVLCDARCRAADGVFAVGDIARWEHPGIGPLRLENRTNAADQARAVTANILGAPQPYAPVPYLWTDQYDTKIQILGTLPPGSDVDIVEGAVEGPRFVARYRHDGVVTGVLGWNMPKQTHIHGKQLTDTTPRTRTATGRGGAPG